MIRIIRNIVFKRPILAIFDVTKLCNERCPMCNIWKTTSSDMDIKKIEKIAKTLSVFGIGYVFIQGGEPTIRTDLVEIIDIFLKYKIKPTIITNSILLNYDLALKISKRKCNLSISLDTMDKAKFKKLRGVDKLETVVNNIKEVAKIKKRKGNWSITTTITKLAELEDVKKVDKFAREYNFMYAIRPYIYVSGKAGKKDESLLYEYKEIEEIYDYYIKIAKKENYLAYLIYKEHVRYLKGNKMEVCDAMKCSFLLKESGGISPCIELCDFNIDIKNFGKEKEKYKNQINKCNNETPCFHNDAREIGILLRNIPDLIFHFPLILKQLIKFGNFF